jgi:hypothetical protein
MNFGPLVQTISNGMDYRYTYRYSRTITDEERTLVRTGLLTHGNHETANDEPDQTSRSDSATTLESSFRNTTTLYSVATFRAGSGCTMKEDPLKVFI